MKTAIIGLGLIGGSMALDLRKAGLATSLVGIDASAANGLKAVELGIVDKIEDEDKALSTSDLVIVAIPVNASRAFLPAILDQVKKDAVVIDTGSTKNLICKTVEHHPKRKQLVAAHPLAGTENSGPTAAFEGLFNGKTNIICEHDKSSDQAL